MRGMPVQRRQEMRWTWMWLLVLFVAAGSAQLRGQGKAKTAAAVLRRTDQPHWGQQYSRNMVSAATKVPDSFDISSLPASGKKPTGSVKWVARLGSVTYASPIVAGGKVLVGTNNRSPRDRRHQGDRGVLMCFNETDGKFLWQLVVPKLKRAKYNGHVYGGDYQSVGISSSPTIVGDRIYLTSNRCEVMCLDLDGMADGNDGPYVDEGVHMAGRDQKPMAPILADADIIWVFDMVGQLSVVPHDATNASVLVHGDLLYVCTGNGVEMRHSKIPNPDAPSLIVLDRKTGKLVAKDDAKIGPDIFHGQYSSPSLGRVGGRTLVFFGGGNGVCYAFEALKSPASGKPKLLKTIWSFKCDTVGRLAAARSSPSRPDPNGPSTIVGMPVFHDNRVYVTAGGEPWHGKRKGGLYCIDATKTGDITRTGRIWSYEALGQSISTPAIADGLVYIAGYDGRIHCLDAETGKPYWVHDTGEQTYGSTLLVDGKIYVGTVRRSLWVLAAGKKKRLISRIRLGAIVYSTPTVANGTLYVADCSNLYAVTPTSK